MSDITKEGLNLKEKADVKNRRKTNKTNQVQQVKKVTVTGNSGKKLTFV